MGQKSDQEIRLLDKNRKEAVVLTKESEISLAEMPLWLEFKGTGFQSSRLWEKKKVFDLEDTRIIWWFKNV